MTHDENRKRFWTAVDAVREHNKCFDPDQIEADVDAAIEEVRSGKKSLSDVSAQGAKPAARIIQ